jgi:hypothetical protein
MSREKDQLLGNLAANGSIGPFHVRGKMSADSGVLTIIGDIQSAGAGVITVEFYVDAAATKGGSSAVVLSAADTYVQHIVCSPDLWFKLTMTGRTADDINLYCA